MADTNDLKVIVSLDIGKSAIEIEKDLPELEKLLASKDSGKLKIVGQLDTVATEKNINQQLSKLKIDNTALKITPQLDISGNNNIGQQITKQVENSTKNIDFSAIAKNLRKAFNINDNASIKEATENIKAMYEAFNVDPAKYKDAFNKLISWYEQRSNDLIYSERQKVDELNNLMLELYNQPELHTTLPGLGKASKNNPLVVTKSTLDEMKSILGSMKEVYKLFGSIRVDDKHGALIGSFGEDWDPKEYNDSLAVYIQYLQKIQELRKNNRLRMSDIASSQDNELFVKMTEQSILNQLGLVDANNKVIQSNEKVSQSERDVAQAQKEVDNVKKSTNADKGNDDALKKLMRTTEILEKIAKQYELIQYYQQQRSQFENGSDEWSNYSKALKNAMERFEATKQVAKEEGLITEEYKKQAIEIQKNIDVKYAQMNNAKTVRNNNGGNYISNNQVQDIFDSLNEAERYFKNFNLGTVTSSLTKGSLQGLKDFVVEVKSATGEVEKFRYAVENIGDDQNSQLIYKLTDIKAANAGIQRLTESTQKYYASMEATITTAQASAQKLKATWSDTNGGKSVKDAEHLDSLKQKYAELMAMIEGLRGQSELEAKQTIADIKAKEKEINSLIGTYHNAEKVATDLRTKGYETVKEITGTKINTFEEKIKGALGSTEQLSAEMTNLRTKFESLNSATTQAEKSTILTSILDDLDKAKAKLENLKEVKKNFDDTSKSVNNVIFELDTMSRAQIFNTHSNNAGVVEFQDKIRNLSDIAKQVKADLNALGDSKAIPSELKARVEELKQKFYELSGSNKTLQANLRQNDGWARAERQIQTLTARVKEYMAVNTKAAKKYSGQFDGLLSGLSQAEMNKDSEAVRRLSADFQILQHEIKAAGDQGKTFGQTIVDNAKRFSSWMTLTGVISTGWRELRKMVNTVIELDTAMTNLRKVTNETEGTYSKFLKNVTTQAKELGMAVTDLIDSTSDFAKLGYSLPDATELAKVASVYANVGELNISDATSSLVSTLAAFKIEAKDAISVVDRLNAVGNSFSISSADIGEALQRSASSLHTANNTLDESIALITAANTVVQDSATVGTALKTLSLRLVSTKAQLEELGEETEYACETISDYRDLVMGLTNNKVDIIGDDGQYLSTYEIIKKISEVWSEMDSMAKSSLMKSLFGARQANVGVSLIEQFSVAEKVLETSLNSAGSAMEEHSRWLESEEAKLKQLEASFQSLSNTVVNSDFIKFLTDSATGALNILDGIISKFGALQTLLPIIMGSLSAFKNVGRAKTSALKREYADFNVVVTRNELIAM